MQESPCIVYICNLHYSQSDHQPIKSHKEKELLATNKNISMKEWLLYLAFSTVRPIQYHKEIINEGKQI